MSNSHQTSEPTTSEEAKSHPVVSLLLLLHCFCITVVLSANFSPSELQVQLVDRIGAYTKLMNFDPNFTPYHLTSGQGDDGDHYLEVVDSNNPSRIVARLPGAGWPGSPAHHRLQILADVVAFHATREMDNITGALAQSIGRHYLATEQNQDRVIVRCQARLTQPRQLDEQPGEVFPEDPNDPSYLETVYEADVWRAEDGSIQVLKRSAQSEVAPTRPRSNP